MKTKIHTKLFAIAALALVASTSAFANHVQTGQPGQTGGFGQNGGQVPGGVVPGGVGPGGIDHRDPRDGGLGHRDPRDGGFDRRDEFMRHRFRCERAQQQLNSAQAAFNNAQMMLLNWQGICGNNNMMCAVILQNQYSQTFNNLQAAQNQVNQACNFRRF